MNEGRDSMIKYSNVPLEKIETGIEGFDFVCYGGLPKGRTTLFAGTAGSGKTVFGLQFVHSGIIEFDEGGVIVTFEETPEELIRNVSSMGWDFQGLIDEGRLAIVDATPTPGEVVVESGAFDLSGLVARVENAVRKVDAKRVCLDAVGAAISQFADANLVRRELRRVVRGLTGMGVTSMITVERVNEYGPISRFGVEEFVADNVVILRNPLDQEKRRRTVEVLKFRGTTHQKGEYPFSIDATDGVTVLPLSAAELKQKSSDVRLSSGNSTLDEMCGGGLFRDSIVLVSGATGTGKTLCVTQFVGEAVSRGETALLFAFEESRGQLTRNATSWGYDFEAAAESGLLKISAQYPETTGLEEHLIRMKREIEEFRPARIAVDSLSALERVGSHKSFREFVIGLTSYIKHQDVVGMFTNTTSMLLGGDSITEAHISTITDSIVLLRYVELMGQMRRGITVLKMRGSQHDKNIREYRVTGQGMEIGDAFSGVTGILTGSPVYHLEAEEARMGGMFGEGS